MQNISYTDKVENNGTTTDGKVSASDMNAIKSVVNANAQGSIIVVKQASDFGTIDSTKVYYIDGIIDMGAVSIEVPAGGISIHGSTFDVSQLISTENSYTMFTSPVGGSGNVLMHDVSISVSGTSSKVYELVDATGFNAIEVDAVNYNDCTSLGSIEEYRQLLENGTGRFGGSPELELIGPMVGGFKIDVSITRNVTIPTALFKAGTGFVFSGRFDFNMNADLPATGAFLDFAPANVTNDDSLQLSGCRITRSGAIDSSDTTIYPNIDENSVKSLWRNNVGLPNTIKYIHGSVTTEIATSIVVIDTYYPLNGTYTTSDESHFDMPANGEFRLLTGNGKYRISGDLTIDGTPNDEIRVRITKSTDGGATWPTEIASIARPINNLQGGRDVAFIPLSFLAEIKKDDRVRLEVKNTTGTDNVTAELESYINISQI